MKICLVNSLYTPDKRGGAEVIVTRLVAELRDRGHEVVVVATDYEDRLDVIDGVRVYRLSASNVFNFKDIQKKPFVLRALFHLIDQFQTTTRDKFGEVLDAEKPDLVLSHNIKGLGYRILHACGPRKIPVVHTLHDIQYAIPSGLMYWGKEKTFMMRNPYNALYALLSKLALYPVDHIVSPSQWLLDFYLGKGLFKHQPTHVVRNPVSLPHAYEPKPCIPTYCFVGQIEEHKGVRLLLESFEIFHDKHPEAKLLVAGTGSLLDELRDAYQHDWVEFLGYVPYDELPIRVFAKSSFAVMTSLVYENSPGAVYDAFACSTPILVPNFGGAPELVTHATTGYIFEPDSHKALLEAFEQAYQSADKYAWMAMHARAEIEKCNFDEYLKTICALTRRVD